MNRLRITVFADPVCTWCWGSVPVLRALTYRYGEQVNISYVMGVMIENIETYKNRRLSIGGDIALSNRNINANWLEASAQHGMPVCESGFHLFSKEHTSTMPQCRAYVTARHYAAESRGRISATAAMHYLRHLQEATAVDAEQTCDINFLSALSATAGFVPSKFQELYYSDAVVQLLREDKALCRDYDVTTFPTFTLEYHNEELMLRGYSSYEIFSQSISQLTFNNIRPINDGRELFSAENVKDFIQMYGTAYPVEIAAAFGLTRKNGHSALNAESYIGLPDVMAQLIESQTVAMAPKGNGFIYYAIKDPGNVAQQTGRRLVGVV